MPLPEVLRLDNDARTIGGFDAGPMVVKPAPRAPWWVRKAKSEETKPDV
jgi:hypothetical protein